MHTGERHFGVGAQRASNQRPKRVRTARRSGETRKHSGRLRRQKEQCVSHNELPTREEIGAGKHRRRAQAEHGGMQGK
jgi:hypothetical protein